MADAADSSNIKNPGLPIMGAGVREKDPVCGMAVDPGKAAAKQEYQGNTYYFCSKRCAEKFARESHRFLPEPVISGVQISRSGNNALDVETVSRGNAVEGALTNKTPVILEAGAGISQRVVAKSPLYTCPMHPQILQIGPGSCPICGMALEPVEVSAEAETDPEYESMARRLRVTTALSVPLL